MEKNTLIKESLRSKKNVVCLEGISGSGKTTELRNAAKDLSEKLNVPVYTNDFHMTHYFNEELEYPVNDKILNAGNSRMIAINSNVEDFLTIEKIKNTGGIVCIDETERVLKDDAFDAGAGALPVDETFLRDVLELAMEQDNVILLYTSFSYKKMPLFLFKNTSIVIDLKRKKLNYLDKKTETEKVVKIKQFYSDYDYSPVLVMLDDGKVLINGDNIHNPGFNEAVFIIQSGLEHFGIKTKVEKIYYDFSNPEYNELTQEHEAFLIQHGKERELERMKEIGY